MFLRCQVLDRCFKIFIPYRHLFHGRNYSLWLDSNNFNIMLVCYSRWMQRLGKANTKVLIKFGLKQCSLMHHLFDRPENGENYVLSNFFLSDLALASSATLHIYSRNKDLNGITLYMYHQFWPYKVGTKKKMFWRCMIQDFKNRTRFAARGLMFQNNFCELFRSVVSCSMRYKSGENFMMFYTKEQFNYRNCTGINLSWRNIIIYTHVQNLLALCHDNYDVTWIGKHFSFVMKKRTIGIAYWHS